MRPWLLAFALTAAPWVHAEKALEICAASADGAIYDRIHLVLESPSISKNGKAYVFKVKPGVPFHSSETFKPTRPLNSEDLAFSLKKAALPQIASVKVADAENFEITLKKPYSDLLEILNEHFVYSAEYLAHLEKQDMAAAFLKTPIGTGPFQFRRHIVGSAFHLEANPAYHRGKPKIDRLTVKLCDDPPNLRYIVFNSKLPPWNRVERRRAVIAALDGDIETATRRVPKGGLDLELMGASETEGQKLQAQLAKVGIRLSLVTYDQATTRLKLEKGEFQAAVVQERRAHGGSDEFWSRWTCGGANASRWCDRQFDRLILKARAERDEAKRNVLYQKAHDVFRQRGPAFLWDTGPHVLTDFFALDMK